MRETLVEDHRDVGSELRLDVRRFFGREEVRRTVEVRSEARPFSSIVRGAARLNTW